MIENDSPPGPWGFSENPSILAGKCLPLQHWCHKNMILVCLKNTSPFFSNVAHSSVNGTINRAEAAHRAERCACILHRCIGEALVKDFRCSTGILSFCFVLRYNVMYNRAQCIILSNEHTPHSSLNEA